MIGQIFQELHCGSSTKDTVSGYTQSMDTWYASSRGSGLTGKPMGAQRLHDESLTSWVLRRDGTHRSGELQGVVVVG